MKKSVPVWGSVLAVVLIGARAFFRRDRAGDGGGIDSLFLILGGLVALLLVLLAVGFAAMRGIQRSVTRSTIRRLPGFAMPSSDQADPPRPVRTHDAVAAVDALERLEFRRVGAYEVGLPDHRAVFSCMLGPESTTLAVVSPAHTSLLTDFGGKLVTTSDDGSGGVMPYELRRVVADRDPTDLVAAHRRAVEAAARATGLSPTTHTTDSALDTLLAIERHGIDNVTVGLLAKGLLRQSLGLAVLFPPAAERVHDRRRRAWAAGPHRWTVPAA